MSLVFFIIATRFFLLLFFALFLVLPSPFLFHISLALQRLAAIKSYPLGIITVTLVIYFALFLFHIFFFSFTLLFPLHVTFLFRPSPCSWQHVSFFFIIVTLTFSLPLSCFISRPCPRSPSSSPFIYLLSCFFSSV